MIVKNTQRALQVMLTLVALIVPTAQASPCDVPPPSPLYLWQFECLYGSPSNVIEKAFDVAGITDLRWSALYEFQALPQSGDQPPAGDWSRALFYATEKGPREQKGPVIYCHIRNGRDVPQMLACVVGDGKWDDKHKGTTEIKPPLRPGEPFRVFLRYTARVTLPTGQTQPGALVASINKPDGTYIAQVRIAPEDGLAPFSLHRVQLGHPPSRDKVDRPSDVVIREGRLMDRTHQ